MTELGTTRLCFHFVVKLQQKSPSLSAPLADGQTASRKRNICNSRYRMKQDFFFLIPWDSLRKSQMTHETVNLKRKLEQLKMAVCSSSCPYKSSQAPHNLYWVWCQHVGKCGSTKHAVFPTYIAQFPPVKTNTNHKNFPTWWLNCFDA